MCNVMEKMYFQSLLSPFFKFVNKTTHISSCKTIFIHIKRNLILSRWVALKIWPITSSVCLIRRSNLCLSTATCIQGPILAVWYMSGDQSVGSFTVMHSSNVTILVNEMDGSLRSAKFTRGCNGRLDKIMVRLLSAQGGSRDESSIWLAWLCCVSSCTWA